MVLILNQNQTSIHEEHFACGTFSYELGFINEKHVQRSQSSKKSRCTWDGVYLRTSITLRALSSDGNERWTRRAGAPPSKEFSKISRFFKIFEISTKISTFKKLQPNRTFAWHCHFFILLARFEASIYNLNLLL